MRLFNFLIAVTVLLVFAPRPSSSAVAIEYGASVDDCAGCDNGNVVLVMDGGMASVFGLVQDPVTGHWRGNGKVSYNAQGVSIEDPTAVFDVELVDSPTAATPGCERATKFASAIHVIGTKGQFTLDASNIKFDLSTPCATATLDVQVNDQPRSIGRLKKLYRS